MPGWQTSQSLVEKTNFWRFIERPIIGLSPMDGVTDASFRYVIAKHGHPDVAFTEFVNISYNLQSSYHSRATTIYCFNKSESFTQELTFNK